MNIRSQVIDQFSRAAKEQDSKLPPFTGNLRLFRPGLYSRCFAILIARLEDFLAVDLFSAEGILFPATFGEFASCYEACAK
jgi:hypothetical protein